MNTYMYISVPPETNKVKGLTNVIITVKTQRIVMAPVCTLTIAMIRQRE